MAGSVSFLLGAGFSAPMGYPIGNQLNELLINCDGNDFTFHTNGHLIPPQNGAKVNIGPKTSYDYEYDFCRSLMAYFKERNGCFDYEEFYDFFTIDAIDLVDVHNLYKKEDYQTFKDLDQMLNALRVIFNQLVDYFLKDENGNSWYDNEGHMGKPMFLGYTGILNCLEEFGKKSIVNVHTLNHDLFFERLSSTDWLNGNLCDGFDDLGSSYFGKLEIKGRSYLCRLSRFVDKYDKKFKLFKLHGSKDYAPYYGKNGRYRSPEVYLKTRYGIGFSDFYKEVKNEDGNLFYDKGDFDFHADFLTGTTSKIERYAEPLLFKSLFKKFRGNLKEAEKLVIIGYGAKDSEINKMIFENFDFESKSSFIIDPYAGDNVRQLQEKLGSKLIEKELEEIELSDLE